VRGVDGPEAASYARPHDAPPEWCGRALATRIPWSLDGALREPLPAGSGSVRSRGMGHSPPFVRERIHAWTASSGNRRSFGPTRMQGNSPRFAI
jgi:hypothetical protein